MELVTTLEGRNEKGRKGHVRAPENTILRLYQREFGSSTAPNKPNQKRGIFNKSLNFATKGQGDT